MLIHLGDDKSVFCKDIIAILHASHPSQREHQLDPTIKSLLITEKEQIYTSISVQTLAKRANLSFLRGETLLRN